MKWLASVCFLLGVNSAVALDYYAGAGLGRFDVDYPSGTDNPYFGSTTYNVFGGADLNKYLSFELNIENISSGSEIDVFDEEHSFQALSLAPTVLLKYPLDESTNSDFFVRLGGSYMSYDAATYETEGEESGSSFQPLFGAGFRMNNFYIEYVNYDELLGLSIEETRIGYRYQF